MKGQAVLIEQYPEKTGAEDKAGKRGQQKPQTRITPCNSTGATLPQAQPPGPHAQRLATMCPLPGKIQVGDDQ